MKPNTELTKHTFIDGDFSMDIIVSEEERTIYLNQNEMAKFLGIGKATVSRNIKIINDLQMGQCDESVPDVQKSVPGVPKLFDLKIIKEIGQKYNLERIEKLEKWLYELLPGNELDIIDGDYEIIRYNQDNLDIPIRFANDRDTLWMTPKEMANLFETTERNIYLHMTNIFEDEELTGYSIVKESFSMGQTGQKYKTTLYNLDMILAVGYRVRSAKAVRFRRWVSSVMKEYLHDNYYGKQDTNLPVTYQNYENRLSSVENKLERLEPKNNIYFRNVSFDAYTFLTFQFSTAKKEIFIIDVYADEFLISALKAVCDGVKVIIVAGKKCRITKEEIEIYHRSHPNVEVTIMEEINEHDRHVFIDRKNGFFLGSSINTIGYHDFHITEITDSEYIKQIIGKYIV